MPADEAARRAAAFDRLLADVSAGFINLPPDQVDAAITDALRRIARLLDVDRTQLIRFVGSDGARVSHSGAVAGIAEGAPDIPLAKAFPWALARMRRGETTVYARLADLPPEASTDVAVWQRYGVKAEIIAPLRVDGVVDGAIVLDSDRAERDWSAEEIARVEVLTSIFGSALAHQRARADLDAAMRFERAASAILARLLGAKRGERDRAIEEGLRDMARALGADRATLWRRAGEAAGLAVSHRGQAVEGPDSVVPAQARLTWIPGQLEQGREVRFARRADLPAEASADAEVLRAMQVGAAMVVPLRRDGRLIGALSLSTQREGVAWPAELLDRAQLLGEAVAGGLAVQDSERGEIEAQATALHAARVGSMGVFAASLVHELTQPLSASLANAETTAELLAAPALDREALQATVADLLADSRRAADMIQKLRRFLRRGEAERVEFDLVALLADVLGFVSPEAIAKGVALHFRSDGDAPLLVHGDRVQIQQVLVNLIVNALDAVASNPPQARRIDVGLAEREHCACITVTDNGAGMAADTAARMFEPFFTTKSGGMGLGLSISQTIVASHGGRLSAHSELGHGTTLCLELPLNQPLEPAATLADAGGSRAGPPGKVFVVDDDPALRRAVQRQLQAQGFDVEGFADAHAFLARAPVTGPACIVCDLRMPGIGGLELQATLVRENRHCAIVFMSGHADVASSVQAMRGGAIAMLTKPVVKAELLAAVAEGLARSRARWDQLCDGAALRSRHASLSAREAEVFELVVAGLMNKTIADRLGIAEPTVKIHRRRVMDKMQAGSVADLVRMGQRLAAAVVDAAQTKAAKPGA